MLIPRYYFTQDYAPFYSYIKSQPHKVVTFKKNDYLWPPGELLTQVFYIESGIAQNLVEHEDGYVKIISFHGPGTVFPGCHLSDFKIENSIVTRAISDMTALAFDRKDFHRMYQSHPALNNHVLEWYAMYINLLIYEAGHQEYNTSFIRLCNLLYLFLINPQAEDDKIIHLTQEDIANILTINRVNAAKHLSRLRNENIIVPHRKWIEVIDMDALVAYCSDETLAL